MTRPGDRESVLINYAARTPERPRYFANDHSRDTVVIDPQAMPVFDGRAEALDLDGAGLTLVTHRSTAGDLADKTTGDAYRREIEALLLDMTGADHVQVTGPPILRFSERSGKAGSSDNSHPARFAHVDLSDTTGKAFSEANKPRSPDDMPRDHVRAAHYNVWRVLSPAPQDVPLALCDARSLTGSELIRADAIFDRPDGKEWQFEGYVVAHDPAHRWMWFPDMAQDEAIIFKTHDSRAAAAPCVPHVAFDDPAVSSDAPARISAEIRAIAYWWQ